MVPAKSHQIVEADRPLLGSVDCLIGKGIGPVMSQRKVILLELKLAMVLNFKL
jgi:hypothetical protein